MSGEIAIRETTLDFHKLVQMAFNKEDWGKQYTLFTHGNITVNIEMSTFDFGDKKACFRIRGDSSGTRPMEAYFSDYAYFNQENMTSDQFFIVVCKRVKREITNRIASMLTEDAIVLYRKERIYTWNLPTKELCERANMMDEYASLKTFKGDLKSSVRRTVEHNARAIIQKPFEDKCKQYMETHTLQDTDMYDFLDRIKIIINKANVEEEL